MAPNSKIIASRIPEEILGTAWAVLEDSQRSGESSPCTHQEVLRSRPRTSVGSAKSVIAGEAPLHSTLWQMQ